MTKYKRGDIILVEVVFSDRTGTKSRPALIISSDEYNNNRQEIIIAAITSNINRVLFSDTKVSFWKNAGLRYPSLVTGILQTIKGSMISKKLGCLSKEDLLNVERNLESALKLEK